MTGVMLTFRFTSAGGSPGPWCPRIRRDLTDLADAGRLERVHGGAVLPSGTTNIGYEDRRGLNEAEKTRIAKACAARIPEDISVFINIGTSTEAVARQLVHHHNLMVVTNNINVAKIAAAVLRGTKGQLQGLVRSIKNVDASDHY